MRYKLHLLAIKILHEITQRSFYYHQCFGIQSSPYFYMWATSKVSPLREIEVRLWIWQLAPFCPCSMNCNVSISRVLEIVTVGTTIIQATRGSYEMSMPNSKKSIDGSQEMANALVSERVALFRRALSKSSVPSSSRLSCVACMMVVPTDLDLQHW